MGYAHGAVLNSVRRDPSRFQAIANSDGAIYICRKKKEEFNEIVSAS